MTSPEACRPRRRLLWVAALAGVCASSAWPAAQQAPPTFSRDVAPILFDHCTSCHRDGEVGGFSLRTYADARPRAAAIARVTRARQMPPWKPDILEGVEFAGARRLPQSDIDVIQRWVDGGAPEGRPADLPPPPVFPGGWQLGPPDLELTMAAPYELAAGGPDVLRNVVIPVPLAAARFVRGFEFRPENRRVVHHANIRVDRTRTARALDGADGAPGFDGRLNAGAEFPDGHFLGWTPGQLPPLASEDTAWRLDPGSDLVVQLHLRPTAQAERVQVRIGLYLTDRAPRRPPVTLRLGRQNIDIAPGRADYATEDAYRLPVDVDLVAIQPHAHFRAREVRASVQLPDGRSRPLLHIADWDFDWQDRYRYATPVALPRGSVLRMSFRYDNSAANRRNPDRPPRRVLWGQRSVDEMGDVWFEVLPKSDDDRRRLLSDFGPKVLAEDATGYETLALAEPDNPRLYEAAAALRLSLGDAAKAISHLETALRLDPASAEAHYNLGTALVRQGRGDAAAVHFAQALTLAPDHVGAHVNLAAVLRSRGDRADARAHLARALALDPRNAAAHTHLAGLLIDERRVSEAVREYRQALAASPDLLEPLTELAWTLATSPDAAVRSPREAVALGERARQLTAGGDVRVLDALAAAYAAAGRYGEAVTVLTGAVDMIGARSSDAARLLNARLASYAKRVPYRDPARADAARASSDRP